MSYKDIREMPTSLKRDELDPSATGYHESVLRAYHILNKVKWLLIHGADREIVFELIELMEGREEIFPPQKL